MQKDSKSVQETNSSVSSLNRSESSASHRTEVIQTLTPPLPVRLSQARHLTQEGRTLLGSSTRNGRSERTGIRSKPPNRSIPNDYVDETSVHPTCGGERLQPLTPVQQSTVENSSASILSASSESKKARDAASSDCPTRTTSLCTEKPKAESPDEACKESIICSRCKRCRCVKCKQPRPLPGLRCGSRFQCLPRDVVDCCSCVWCVGAAYRGACSNDLDDDGDDDGDDDYSSNSAMCACSSSRRGSRGSCCRRWTVLMALVPCLPCLCLYWPLRWVLSACSACYNGRRRGCRCRPAENHRHKNTEEPLIVSEPDSSNSSSA